VAQIQKRRKKGFVVFFDGHATPEQFAFVTGVEATEDAQQSGLATAIAALHLHQVPGLEFEIQPTEQHTVIAFTEQGLTAQQWMHDGGAGG